MLFIMDTTTVNEFAAVADAASKDYSRPAICLVSLELDREDTLGTNSVFAKMTLRAVATDSYVLGLRQYEFGPGEYGMDKDFDDTWSKASAGQKSPVLVDAREWKKALKDITAYLKGPIPVKALVLIDGDGVTITADSGEAPEFKLRNNADQHSFPKYRSLITGPQKQMEGDWPAFNATKLQQMNMILSAKPADRGTFPVKVYATEGGTNKAGTEMRPWLFIQTHDKSRAEILVMPVRV